MQNLEIRVGNNGKNNAHTNKLCATIGAEFPEIQQFVCTQALHGRFVSIHEINNTSTEMNFCEVYVYQEGNLLNKLIGLEIKIPFHIQVRVKTKTVEHIIM